MYRKSWIYTGISPFFKEKNDAEQVEKQYSERLFQLNDVTQC
jgi:hypothetical protein